MIDQGEHLMKFIFYTILFLTSNLQATETQNLRCIGKRCTYRLINPAVFSADQLRTAASQALTGLQHNRLSQQDAWIGPGSGPFANLEIAFYAEDSNLLNELKKIINELDSNYNQIALTPIRVTAQIYVVEESALRDIGFGIDGFWGGNHFNSTNGSTGFSPTSGVLSGFFGSVANLLRLQLRLATDEGNAMRIEDRSEYTYHGSSFNFSETQDYFRDGPVNTDEGVIGFKFSGNIFVDKNNKSTINVNSLNLYIGFAPDKEQNTDGNNKSPYGVRKIELPSEYNILRDGIPQIIYETIVYAHYDDDSFGLFSGNKRGGNASRWIVILTADVDPEEMPVPDFSKYTPEELRKLLSPGKEDGWHENKVNKKDNKKSKSKLKPETNNENLFWWQNENN